MTDAPLAVGMTPPHPGEFVRDEILDALGRLAHHGDGAAPGEGLRRQPCARFNRQPRRHLIEFVGSPAQSANWDGWSVANLPLLTYGVFHVRHPSALLRMMMTWLQDRDRKGWIMTTKVIPGSFRGSQSKLATLAQPRVMPPPTQAKTAVRPPGPPATALAARPPGPPARAFAGRPTALHRQAATYQAAMQPKMASPTIQPARRGWELKAQYGFTGGRIREAGPSVHAAAPHASLNLNDRQQWPALPTPTYQAIETDLPPLPPQQAAVVGNVAPKKAKVTFVRVPKIPEIAPLMSKKEWTQELSAALKAKYGDALGAEMSRQMKIAPTTDELVLKKRAEQKIGVRTEKQYESESKSSDVGSGRLNVKKREVPNLKKGLGQGFAAGDPARWHVHFNHVKWGTSKKTRINFENRDRQDILDAFLRQQQQPAATSPDRQSWDESYQWMLTNL